MSYFSKFCFLFHLKNHHSKDVNFKFQLKQSSHLDVGSICILQVPIISCKLNYIVTITRYVFINTCTFVYNLASGTLFKGELHPWALFLKVLCIFSKNKATSDKVSYGSGQKCSKELKNHSFTSVETIVVKLQWKMCENQYFPCFEP